MTAGLPAPSRSAWPGGLLVPVCPLWRYFFCRFGKRWPVPFFLFLEKLRVVALQLVPEELYYQVSEAFAEFHPEGPQYVDQYEEGCDQQFLGRADYNFFEK